MSFEKKSELDHDSVERVVHTSHDDSGQEVASSAQDVSDNPDAVRRKQRLVPIWFGRLARAFAITLIVPGAAAWFVYRSAQREPEFYREVLEQTPESLAVEGDALESRVVELQNSVQEPGQWQTMFTQSQINGWLGSDLPEKFPDLLPPEVSEPGVAIQPGEIQAAFRFSSPRLKGIVVIEGDVFVTGDNEISIQLKSVRSGVLPLSVSGWADEISKSMRKSGIPVAWSELDGDPVAIISLPEDQLQMDNLQVVVNAIESRDGEIALSGTTEEINED